MDKKVNLKLFFLFIFILSNMDSHSQQMFWKPKKEVVTELYESMQKFVNDTTPVFVEYNKFNLLKMNLFDLFNTIFNRKKNEKQITLQKQVRQNKMKTYLDSNFVIVNDSVASFGFKDRNKIIEWGKNLEFSPFMPFSEVFSEEFCIKDNNVFILIIYGFSGIPCVSFYVFRDNWRIPEASAKLGNFSLNHVYWLYKSIFLPWPVV